MSTYCFQKYKIHIQVLFGKPGMHRKKYLYPSKQSLMDCQQHSFRICGGVGSTETILVKQQMI